MPEHTCLNHSGLAVKVQALEACVKQIVSQIDELNRELVTWRASMNKSLVAMVLLLVGIVADIAVRLVIAK